MNQLLSAVRLTWSDQVSFNKLRDIVRLVPAVSCFMKFDANSSGSLTTDELRKIAKHLQDQKMPLRSKSRKAAARLMVS